MSYATELLRAIGVKKITQPKVSITKDFAKAGLKPSPTTKTTPDKPSTT